MDSGDGENRGFNILGNARSFTVGDDGSLVYGLLFDL